MKYLLLTVVGILALVFIGTSTPSLSVAAMQGDSQGTLQGSWTISPLPVSDQVEFTLQMNSEHRHMNSSSAAPLSQFRGLTAAQLQNSPAARFELVRDAGTFQLEGYLKNGSGGGTWTFAPNRKFTDDMRSLGYNDLSPEMVFSMAVHDVSIAFVHDLNSASIGHVSADHLVAMRIHGVSIDFIHRMQGLGYSKLSADKLIAMRIHGVTPEFIRKAQSKTSNNVSIDQLVSLKIHGVLD